MFYHFGIFEFPYLFHHCLLFKVHFQSHIYFALLRQISYSALLIYLCKPRCSKFIFLVLLASITLKQSDIHFAYIILNPLKLCCRCFSRFFAVRLSKQLSYNTMSLSRCQHFFNFCYQVVIKTCNSYLICALPSSIVWLLYHYILFSINKQHCHIHL